MKKIGQTKRRFIEDNLVEEKKLFTKKELQAFGEFCRDEGKTQTLEKVKEKFILDACCGTKMFWTNKNHPNVLYMDIREEEKGFIEQQQNLSIKPDVIGDFTNLPDEVKENKYKLIIWDVPHFVKRKITGIMLKKFGCLNPETWQSDINKGFKELWSVLDDYGVLLFKFSDYHIKFDKILNCIPEKPLIFNKMNSKGGTECKWFCFMKIPEKELLSSLEDKEQPCSEDGKE